MVQPGLVGRRNISQLVIVKFGSILIAAIAVIFLSVLPSDTQGGTKPVMVHYMPWFQSPYSLGTDNWGYHWTLNHFNPNTINPTDDEDEIASWYYPLIGP